MLNERRAAETRLAEKQRRADDRARHEQERKGKEKRLADADRRRDKERKAEEKRLADAGTARLAREHKESERLVVAAQLAEKQRRAADLVRRKKEAKSWWVVGIGIGVGLLGLVMIWLLLSNAKTEPVLEWSKNDNLFVKAFKLFKLFPDRPTSVGLNPNPLWIWLPLVFIFIIAFVFLGLFFFAYIHENFYEKYPIIFWFIFLLGGGILVFLLFFLMFYIECIAITLWN